MKDYLPSSVVLRWRTVGGWQLEQLERAMYQGKLLIIPRYFKTDLASIPRLFRSFVPQVARHLIPAVFHDAAYRGLFGMTRAEADQMFSDFMKLAGVGQIRRRAMYTAVRTFGGLSWKGGE